MTRRLAAVDIGTNSVRLLIADVRAGAISAEHLRRTEITRLGQGVDRTGELHPAALERTLAVLAHYAACCARSEVEEVRVAATSATRDARNRAILIDGVRRLLGVDPEVLGGEQEAAASFVGALSDLTPTGCSLVFDIGGGSTELAIGVATPERTLSANIGCVRLTERHLHHDPPLAAEVESARADAHGHLQHAREVLGDATGRIDCDRSIGLAGTVTTIAALVMDLGAYDRRAVHHAVLQADALRSMSERLCAMTVAERLALPVITEGRADVLAAGSLVLAELCSVFDLQEIVVSEHDILDGIILGLAHRLDVEDGIKDDDAE